MDLQLNHEYAKVGDTVYELPHKAGDTLPNQATLIQERNRRLEGTGTGRVRRSTVLAMVPGTVQQYVVWNRAVGFATTDSGEIQMIDYTSAGDYHNYIEDAVKDYLGRSL